MTGSRKRQVAERQGTPRRLGDEPPLARHRAPVRGRRRRAASRPLRGRAHARAARRRAALASAHDDEHVAALGAMTGGQAVQMVKAGLKAIYLSGWQVAADANLSGQTYPDQSLYPANSVPALVRRLNNALLRATRSRPPRATTADWLLPILADAEAGFGGPLNAFELMKAMIEAGAAGVHFEDQLAAEKKCGHLGRQGARARRASSIRTLIAARLAADVLGVPTVLVARTDALSATLLTSDVDPNDREFLTGERTPEGFFRIRDGLERGDRARRSPTRRTPTCSGSRPRRRTWARPASSPRRSTSASPASCSPTTARRRSTGSSSSTTPRSRRFQDELGALGYRFQFVTLAGLPRAQRSLFELAHGYAERRDDRLRRASGTRVRARGARLHRDAAPARGRRRLLRRRAPGARRRARRSRSRVDRRSAIHAVNRVETMPEGVELARSRRTTRSSRRPPSRSSPGSIAS